MSTCSDMWICTGDDAINAVTPKLKRGPAIRQTNTAVRTSISTPTVHATSRSEVMASVPNTPCQRYPQRM